WSEGFYAARSRFFARHVARAARIRLPRPGRRCGVSRWGGATAWIVLTCVLGAAVIGLGIWVVVLETGHESESTASAARIGELEQAETDLTQQVSELEAQVNDLEAQLEEEKAAAGAASDEAQKQLEALRDEVQAASDGLGAKGQELSDLQAEL